MTVIADNEVPIAEDFANCLDCDAHEMIPTPMWTQEFGDIGQRFIDICGNMDLLSASGAGENAIVRDDIDGDTVAITSDNVWGIRGPDAPSAIDLGRRAEVLDLMGVEAWTSS